MGRQRLGDACKLGQCGVDRRRSLAADRVAGVKRRPLHALLVRSRWSIQRGELSRWVLALRWPGTYVSFSARATLNSRR